MTNSLDFVLVLVMNGFLSQTEDKSIWIWIVLTIVGWSSPSHWSISSEHFAMFTLNKWYRWSLIITQFMKPLRCKSISRPSVKKRKLCFLSVKPSLNQSYFRLRHVENELGVAFYATARGLILNCGILSCGRRRCVPVKNTLNSLYIFWRSSMR